jgi:hypothetical protein
VIAKHLATLREMQEYYSYSDAQDLYDLIIVQNYNDWVIHENAKRK